MRKAISPLVATVMIAAVTLIAAVAIGAVVFGAFGPAGLEQLSMKHADCVQIEQGLSCTFVIQNPGRQDAFLKAATYSYSGINGVGICPPYARVPASNQLSFECVFQLPSSVTSQDLTGAQITGYLLATSGAVLLYDARVIY